MLHYERVLALWSWFAGWSSQTRTTLAVICAVLAVVSKLMQWNDGIWIAASIVAGIALLTNFFAKAWD